MVKMIGCAVLLVWATVAAGAEGADVRALKADVRAAVAEALGE